MEPDLAYLAGFSTLSAELYWKLVGIEWDLAMVTRRTASFGVPYTFADVSYPTRPMHALLRPICESIDAQLGFRPNSALLNYYVDGDSTMGPHTDDPAQLRPGTDVAILSLGAERTLIFTNADDRTVTYRRALAPGSLLHLHSGGLQSWLRSIEAEPGVGPRISVTFRRLREED